MILSLDIGTSNFKAAVFDFKGNRIAFSLMPLLINNDSNQWLNAYKECYKELAASFKIDAIVITGNGPTLVPVLEDNTAAEVKLWLDNQNLNKCDIYQKEVSDVMGGFVDAKFFLPKILKIKNEEKEIYSRTKHFLGCPEYLAFVLTGKAFSVFPSQGFDRWFWNDESLKKLDLDAAKFPPFIKPGDIFGYTDNIPVISGGPDFFAAILGAGITEPGQALDRTGSSEGINLCTVKRHNLPGFMSYGHPVSPYWNLSCIIKETGLKIEKESKIQGFSGIEEFIQSEKSKSVLEEMCFTVKDIITSMEKTGEPVKELRVTGGLSANESLNRLKASITGKTIIELENKEAELLGCAIIGLCALGKYGSYAQACKEPVKIKKIYN